MEDAECQWCNKKMVQGNWSTMLWMPFTDGHEMAYSIFSPGMKYKKQYVSGSNYVHNATG